MSKNIVTLQNLLIITQHEALSGQSRWHIQHKNIRIEIQTFYCPLLEIVWYGENIKNAEEDVN